MRLQVRLLLKRAQLLNFIWHLYKEKAKTAQVLELDSLQSVTAQGVKEGVSYLGVMEQNLEVLKTALGTR